MAVWSGELVASYIRNITNEQIQPAGVDLRVDEIYVFESKGEILKGERRISKLRILNGNKWHLKPGAYLVRYMEEIRIPRNAIGIVLPRSSLLRSGATILTAVWDPGYFGRGIGLLVVFNPNGITLERGARIAQMIFVSAEARREYEGIYKGEGLHR